MEKNMDKKEFDKLLKEESDNKLRIILTDLFLQGRKDMQEEIDGGGKKIQKPLNAVVDSSVRAIKELVVKGDLTPDEESNEN